MLLRPPGVYRAQDDTDLLLTALRNEPVDPHRRVLDVGTGTGAVAMAAARHGGRVTAVDAALRAVLTTRCNARLHHLPIRVLHGDLLGAVDGDRFDLVLANPPYVPSPSEHLPRRGAARAWDAGPDGRAVVDRICRDAPSVLAPGGTLLMVHSALCGTARTLELLGAAGLAASVAERRWVPFGPVMRARAAWLESVGLIGPGEEKEELVVFRAVARN